MNLADIVGGLTVIGVIVGFAIGSPHLVIVVTMIFCIVAIRDLKKELKKLDKEDDDGQHG